MTQQEWDRTHGAGSWDRLMPAGAGGRELLRPNSGSGPAAPNPTGGPGTMPGGNLGNVNNALNTAGQVNKFNLDYVHGALAADPGYQSALRLLDPNDAQANYDVTLHGAERSIAGGVPGSGLGSETTGRLRQSDIERRAAEGSQLLSQAYGRTPTPFDVSSQLLTPYQSGQLSLQQGHLNLEQAQLALDDKIRSGQLQLSQQDLALRDKIQSGQLTLDQARLALQDRIQSGQLSIENARLMFDWYRALFQQGQGGYNNRGGGGGGTGGLPPSSPGSGQPSWRGGSDLLPPLPGDPSGGRGWSDTNPPYTINPYTNSNSPYYQDPGQGFDYSPYGEGDLFDESGNFDDYYSYA